MKRKSFEKAVCPVARALDAIGDWWSLLIIRNAFAGQRRFGEFQKSLGMARNILASRLRKLTACGILEIAPASDGSAYSEYALTEKGRGLFHVLEALRQWGAENLYGPGEAGKILVDRVHGRPVRKLELRAEDGRVLGPGETLLMLSPAAA
ncbi:MAG TPA: helix-turn-helix domain-containing protein [Chthoniobacteraceae bacterium]|nr:helix-turn-helix domain-containing protein [Chthoniobacteraceae bacterium]